MEATKHFPWSGDHPHLVVLTVPDERALSRWADTLAGQGYPVYRFFEPDLCDSLTAFAVPGVRGERREAFRVFITLKLAAVKEKSTMKFQSRFGFHPCDIEQFRRLRRLNFLAFQARRRLAAWKRWARKAAHNRRRLIGGKNGWEGSVLREIPKTSRVYEPVAEPIRPPIDLDMADVIAEDYRNARIPVVESQVKSLVLSETKIDLLLESLEKWWVESTVTV